jgi:hypothetical protein
LFVAPLDLAKATFIALLIDAAKELANESGKEFLFSAKG